MEYRWRSLLVELTQARLFAHSLLIPSIYLKPSCKGELDQIQGSDVDVFWDLTMAMVDLR